jgi:hypothetical protein
MIQQRWEVVYYRSPNTIAFKSVYAKDAESAIKKARVKNLIDLYPCVKERKKAYTERVFGVL